LCNRGVERRDSLARPPTALLWLLMSMRSPPLQIYGFSFPIVLLNFVHKDETISHLS
jgi:hypothetical protein